MASPASYHHPSPALTTTATTASTATASATTITTNVTGLQDLPNELLQAIAAWLIPDPPATTRFALRPVGTWEVKNAADQWAEWQGRHRDLQALALTSRRLADIAAAYRYHAVVVHSGAGLVRLFRHLVERPGSRGCIHSLTCLVNLLDADVINDTRREWTALIQSSFQIPPGLLSLRGPGAGHPARPAPTPRPDSGLAVALFNFVIGYADNLADLLLAHPDQTRRMLNVSLVNYLFEVPGLSTAKTASHFLEPQLFPTKASLQRLSSLRLYCNREGANRDETFTQAFAKHVVSSLPELSNLKTLELCCDSVATWHPLFDIPNYPSLPSLRHVRLYGSRIREPELVALCRACVNLETLVVHFEDCCDDELDRPRLPEAKTLNDALLGLADSLRHLELVALSEGHYLTRGRERPRKPENHRLACFSQLHRLRDLTVDYRGLFGTLGTFEYEDGESLRVLLPRSLRRFTLVCEWGTEGDFRQSYLADLDMMLDGIKLLCLGSNRPRLTNISLAVHRWPETGKYRTKFRRNIEQVRASCDRTGIRFQTFDPLPEYRDEDEAEDQGEEEGEEGEGEDENSFETEIEEEAEEEDSEYYFTGDDEADHERDAQRPATFDEFLQRLGEDHGHDVDELYYAYYEDRWDEYLF